MQIQKQYCKLTNKLKDFFTWRLIPTLFICLGLIIFVNKLSSRQDTQLSNLQSEIPYSIFSTKIKNYLQVLEGMVSVIDVTLSSLNFVQYQNSSLYCHLNNYNDDCGPSFVNSYSFKCISGTCIQISPLYNYFQVIRKRNKISEFLIISYEINNLTHTLVHPINSNINGIVQNYNFQWAMIGSTSGFILSKTFNLNHKITISAMISQIIIYQISGLLFDDLIFINSSIKSSLSDHQLRTKDKILLCYVKNHFQYIQSNLILNNVLIIFIILITFSNIMFGTIKNIEEWSFKNFKHLKTLNNLYRLLINQIFRGQFAKVSVILQKGSMSDFYEQISQITKKDYKSLVSIKQQNQRYQRFKFQQLIDRIQSKFEDTLKPLAQLRTRCVGNIKHIIKNQTSDINEAFSKELKQIFLKSKELRLTKIFFYFAYLAILEDSEEFNRILSNQIHAVPKAIQSLFRRVNETLNSRQIGLTFKLGDIHPIIQTELIMNIQFNLRQKYYSSIRELDLNMSYANSLGFQSDLRYMQDMIQNQKYLFVTHLK